MKGVIDPDGRALRMSELTDCTTKFTYSGRLPRDIEMVIC